ncbi:inositol monophosphatase family protein [Compostibacter hankyongensis]|uniref:Inositol-1-monophosphatase n=1 Tax=Compostibacter hankyongensis TaxID=1007089 RepID=A0ABP8FSY4_9BACT
MLKPTLFSALQAGGKILQEYFGKSYAVSSKTTVNDLVTEVDKRSETAIMTVIREAFPDHFILSEESGEIKQDSAYKWIIDPIDGTVNYAQGIPLCCISIAVEEAGQMLMGAVYNPFLKELFFAQRGAGATLNDQKISVSSRTDFGQACLATGFPYRWTEMPNDPAETMARAVRRGLPVRRLGSAAIDLCWVACGRFDGYWEHQLNAWDSAAGFLIVEEAGGKVTDFSGNAYSPYRPPLVASNGLIHDALLEMVNG